MLGTDLTGVLRDRSPKHNLTLWDVEEADITDNKAFDSALEGLPEPPEVIINCAAFTAVDLAETEREAAMRINGDGAGNISRAARRIGARVVYISTDYIFDGKKETPWREDDPTEPVNWYGQTKLEGEKRTLDACPDALIVRTQWLYGPEGKNFVETILKLADERDELRVVDDQRGSPTYTEDLARALTTLVEGKHQGVYHVANSGETTWFDFAREIMTRTGKDVRVVPVSTEDYPAIARRPGNSVFDMMKFQKDTGMTMPSWREGLAAYLRRKNLPVE